MEARDATALVYIGEMHAVQLDLLASVLGVSDSRTRAAVTRWRAARLADSGRIGPGRPWVWLTRAGLTTCGLGYPATPPALSRLAHLRAVTAVRLALETTPGYQAAGAYWRGERRLRSRLGGGVGRRTHLPDAEVHWPDGTGVAWAGECWAVEAELTRKTVARTAAIMTEVLTRTGDYGCPAAEAHRPGAPARHARVVYVCARAALATVARARESLGPLGARVEIRELPRGAELPDAVPPRAVIRRRAHTLAGGTP